MSANIAIGIQDFSTLIENHYFYVDKTDFIKEWWDCGDSVTLITRPRRFGKTLTMSMVEQFFSVEYSGRSDLFEDLKIWEDKKYRNIQGTYPVISLSFANVKEPTYQLAEKKICELIAQLYVKYDFITESGKLRDTEVKLYKKIMTDMEYVDATLSLYEVCSKRYLDLEVQPERLKNEFQAICNLMDRYAYGGFPIFIADRGFSSYNVFAHAIENNVDFLIRAKDLNVQRFLGVGTLPDKLDTTIELILTRIQSKKKHKHPEKESQYRYICKNIAFDYLNPADISDEYLLKLRIVRVEVSDGVFENIITTLSEEDFTPDDIKYCYNLRWSIMQISA